MLDYNRYEDFHGLLNRFFDYIFKEYPQCGIQTDKKGEILQGIYSFFGPDRCMKVAISWFMEKLDKKTYSKFQEMTPEQMDIYLTLRGY